MQLVLHSIHEYPQKGIVILVEIELIFLPNIIPNFPFGYHLLKNIFFKISRKIFANVSYNNRYDTSSYFWDRFCFSATKHEYSR